MRAILLVLVIGCAATAEPAIVGNDSRGADAQAMTMAPTPAAAPRAPSDTGRTMPLGCQAPLQLAQEVQRLLAAAAAHATRSASCKDGRGRHVTIEQVHVCPAPSASRRTVLRAEYRVRVQGEGDTRACQDPGDCEWRKPVRTEHAIELAFVETKDGLVVELPPAVPGIEDMTPLAERHDGDCYGASDPFVPMTIRRSR